ncbi:nicotinamide mononucleotide transporter, partial [Pseudomonas aeruginosa]|uniref:nicotinamide mononucleotide transporter n=1 Tax=Pseudomonas aeruginosa TaxID=287 RepID=UPI002F918040
MSPLELFAASLGAIAVYLTVRQNPWCWPIGLVMVALQPGLAFAVEGLALCQFRLAALAVGAPGYAFRREQQVQVVA